MAPVPVMPAAMMRLLDTRRRHDRGGTNGRVIDAEPARLPQADVTVVILSRAGAIRDSLQVWRKSANGLECVAPEREIGANQAQRPRWVDAQLAGAVVLDAKRCPVADGEP